MLEGHVVRALLAPYLRQLSLFQNHEFIHGLSAPAFLFGAGMTFVISTRKRWHEYERWGEPLARRVGRLLFILTLGLAIHLPFYSFRKILMDGTQQDYLSLFQSDVLACIGLGLLALHLIIVMFRNGKRFYALALALTLLVCFATPPAWDLDPLRNFPVPIAQLMNSQHGSPFPLFPYVGFLFAGVLVAWEFYTAVEQNRLQLFMLRLAVTGVALIAGGILIDALPFGMYPHYDFWYTSPNYFLIRAGSLMAGVAGCWYVSQKIRTWKPWMTVLGRESLFVYVLHLVFLYGTAMNPRLNIQTIAGGYLQPGQAILIAMLMILGMFVITLGWNYLKRKQFTLYRVTQLAAAGIFLYYFFTNDY